MRKYTGYLLAGFILCAHTESKSFIVECAIMLCGGFWWVTNHLDHKTKEITAELHKVKMELETAISDGNKEVIAACEAKMTTLHSIIENQNASWVQLFGEAKEHNSQALQDMKNALKKHQEGLEQQLQRQDEERKRRDRELKQEITAVYQEVSDTRRAFDDLKTDVKQQLAAQQKQQAQQLIENNQCMQKIVTETFATHTETVKQEFVKERQQRAQVFEGLKQQFTQNIGASEQKMQELVSQSQAVISGEIRSLNNHIQRLDEQLKNSREEDRVFILSKMTALQEESQRQLDGYLTAFDDWKLSCDARLSVLENGQQSTTTTLASHGSWIKDLQEQNKQLKGLIEKLSLQLEAQNKKLDEQVEQNRVIAEQNREIIETLQKNKQEEELRRANEEAKKEQRRREKQQQFLALQQGQTNLQITADTFLPGAKRKSKRSFDGNILDISGTNAWLHEGAHTPLDLVLSDRGGLPQIGYRPEKR